jgi:hypothetical protein
MNSGVNDCRKRKKGSVTGINYGKGRKTWKIGIW